MTLLPNYKDIVDLIKKGSTLEAQEKIIELKEGALALQEENLKLREQINELEAALKVKEKVIWNEPLYWIEKDGKKDGPYCQQCYDNDRKLNRVVERSNYFICMTCKSRYDNKNFRYNRQNIADSEYDIFDGH